MDALDAGRTEYGLLFSSWELPGIGLSLVSGIILVYVPHAPAAALLASSITVASAISALAVAYTSYTLLLIGQFLLGLTQGALTTVQGAIIAHYFSSHVGTGFGVMLLTSRMSSFAGLTLPALFASWFGLRTSMWISTAITIPSLICTAIYAIESSRRETFHNGDTVSSIRFARSFPHTFWLVCYLWIIVSGVVYVLLHFAPDALSSQLNFPPTLSGTLSASLMVVAAITSPILGAIQDRLHHRASIISASCAFLFMGTMLLMNVLHAISWNKTTLGVAAEALIALLMFTISFSVAPVTLMTCIALIVDDSVMPAALGIYKAGECAALAVLHGLFGILRDISGAYFLSLGILAILALSGIPISLRLGAHLTHCDSGITLTRLESQN